MTAKEAKALSDNVLDDSNIMHFVYLAIVSRAKLGFRFVNLHSVHKMDDYSTELKFLVGDRLVEAGYKITGHPDDGIWYANWK